MKTRLRRELTVFRPRNRSGAALFVTVMSVALIVSVIGLAGLTVIGNRRHAVQAANDVLLARSNAYSAVEVGLRQIGNDPNWRTSYSNGVETNQFQLGAGGTATASWMLYDTDGRIDDADTDLRLKGIGRVGDTVQVLSTRVTPTPQTSQEQQLRSHESSANQAYGEVNTDLYWCQYLKVTLPPGATGWRITRIELYCEKKNGGPDLHVKIYEPLPSNMPSTTVIDSVSRTSDSFLDISWQSIDFSGQYSLDPDAGVCIALEATGKEKKAPIGFYYRASGVSDADSALITGNPAWNTYDTNKSLRYRLYGEYTIGSGLQSVKGTWKLEPAP